MNFFEHQQKARNTTWILVAFLATAVVGLILLTVLAISVTLYFTQQHATSIHAVSAYQTDLFTHLRQLLLSELTLWVSSGVILVVICGSLWKASQLSGGGQRVAEALGGKKILPESRTADERKILNVVEEMAIASGNPVPPVYIMEDQSINAFAAGLTRRDAVIGVTRGCIESLTRDELQGVIAHEFSHIHNGDMRLNMKLTSILHGILVIGLIGRFMMRSSHHRHSYSSNRKNGNQIALLGVLLTVIGYTGTFFGNMIKSAVSRQREFLADASAVQFTRNPTGIGGALKKIGGAISSSYIQHANTAEFSHFYFASGIRQSFTKLFATHPPLSERILKIEPRWDGQFSVPEHNTKHEARNYGSAAEQASFVTHTPPANKKGIGSTIDNLNFEDKFGVATPNSINKSIEQINCLPTILHDAAVSAYSVRAIAYSLLISEKESISAKQFAFLKAHAQPHSFQELKRLYFETKEINKDLTLTLLLLCIPALKGLSKPQYTLFKRNLVALIRADKRIDLYEWCIYRIITYTVEQLNSQGSYSLRNVEESISTLLSAAANLNKNYNREKRALAYSKGAQLLSCELTYKDHIELKEIDRALKQLERLKPLQKPALIKAVRAILIEDHLIESEEQFFLRAIADTLNCPLPPF